jgi:signal transduction histidine kinase
VALLILLAVWATMFHYIMVDEINDETDDSLEEYSEYIIMQALAGKELPSADNGTNNSYHIQEVTAEYAEQVSHVEYFDREIYIESMKETEPARVLRTIFRNADNRYYELNVMIPTFEKSDILATILWWSVSLYIILLLTIIALNAWVIYRSFRPLYALLNWLDGLTLGGEVPPLKNDTKVTEFRRLNEAMLLNTKRNNEMYEEQRSFIGNASHEMQTPIAICINRLEILANDPSLTEEQLGEVLKVMQTLDHLSRLNRTLLLLAKIESSQVTESSEIDVNKIVKNITADYSEVYSARGISVETTEEALLKFTMNESLASTLLSNLIKNAFVHSPERGIVNIHISSRYISISNTAEGDILDEKLIFRRFYQDNKKSGSMGLGLSLVESICRIYGMSIIYDFRNGLHRFTISLSKKPF